MTVPTVTKSAHSKCAWPSVPSSDINNATVYKAEVKSLGGEAKALSFRAKPKNLGLAKAINLA